MTHKTRITVAALVTAVFIGAMSAAGALTHSPASVAVAASHASPVAAPSARQATPYPDDDFNND